MTGSGRRAPLVAAAVAAVLTGLGVLAWRAFEAVPCEGFGCLGPALIAVVTIPIGAVLLGWLALRVLGLPRAFLVSFLTMGSAYLVGSSVALPDPVLLLYWALPAGLAAAWAWALRPGRPGRAPLLVAAVVAAVSLAGWSVRQWQSAQDAEARLDDTNAPQLVVDDDEWELIGTDVRPESFGTLYDRRGTQDRVAVTAVDPRPEADVRADCAELTTTLFDNPAEACTDVGDGWWEVRSGSLTRYLVLRADAVVGFEGVTPLELSRDDVETLSLALRESTAAEIRDRLAD